MSFHQQQTCFQPHHLLFAVLIPMSESSPSFVAVRIFVSPPSPGVVAVVLSVTLQEVMESALSEVAVAVLGVVHWTAVLLAPLCVQFPRANLPAGDGSITCGQSRSRFRSRVRVFVELNAAATVVAAAVPQIGIASSSRNDK